MTDEEVASNEARLCGEGLRLRAALKYLSPSEYRAYAQAEKALAEPLPEGEDWFSGQASRADLSADRQHRSRVIDERVRRYAATEANLMERFGQVADERGLKAIGRLQSSGQECPLPDGFWHCDTNLNLKTAYAEADGQAFDGIRILSGLHGPERSTVRVRLAFRYKEHSKSV